MKKLIVIALIFSAQFIAAQNQTNTSTKDDPVAPKPMIQEQKDNLIYDISGIEVKPEFPGGMDMFFKFANSNFKMPEEDISGKIFIMFIVEKDGSLSDIKVLRDLGYGTGKETIRLLKMSPKWIPGKQNGKPVRVLYSLPLVFGTDKKITPLKK